MAKITLKRFLNLLNEYPVKQFPQAGRFIVNEMAFQARQTAITNIKRTFITRNNFVTNRVQFEMAPFTRNPRELQSKMGFPKEIGFMADQEQGFTMKARKGNKLAVPTRAARISQSIQKKKRSIYRQDRLGRLIKIKSYKGTNKRQKIIAMLQDVARNKDKRAMLIPFDNKPGIYAMKNIRKGGSRKSGFRFKLHKLYDLSRKSVRVAPHKWYKPAIERTFRHEGNIVERAWMKFLSRVR